MNLNNRGWGLSVFLGFVVILLLCIIVAGANAYKLGLTKDSHEQYFESEIPMNTPNSTETPVPTESSVPILTPTPTSTPTPSPSPTTSPSSNNIVPTPSATAVPSSISTNVNLVDVRQDAIQAAGIYKNLNRKSMAEGDRFVISFRQLMAYNYMKVIEGCSGYVEVKVINRNIQYIPYLNCAGYVSNGYNSELDEK